MDLNGLFVILSDLEVEGGCDLLLGFKGKQLE